MAVSTRSEFVDFIVPLGNRLKLYDPTRSPTDQPKNDAADPAKALPQGFIDAMIVREQVYVVEQKVPLENELDDDDRRSYHWVAYASVPAKISSPEIQPVNSSGEVRRVSNSTKIPIGTIRLVPPPHPPHPTPNSDSKLDSDNQIRKDSTVSHDKKEAYIKIGRLTVIPEFRKAGISKLLIDSALGFARDNPYELMPHYDPAKVESLRQESDRGVGMDWKGLVLVHSQTGVQKVWKRYGFETDQALGVWDEEGIPHVGMWKRLDVERGRRASKPWGLSSPLASP